MECWRLEYITEKDKCFFVYSLNTFVLQMYKFFPPHQAILQCSVDTNWVSYTLVQFWHCLPGISTDPSHRFRSQSQKTAPCPPRFRCQVQIVTCASDWPPENETSHDPLLGFGNLLELQETFTFTDLLYNKSCIKGYRWTAGWTDT